MSHVGILETRSDLVGPLLELGGVDLDDRPALATGQVMVVHVDSAAAKEALASVGHDHVDLVGVGEALELGVDGRQRDSTAAANDQGVQLLSAEESLDASERGDDLSALGGVARGDHEASVLLLDLFSGIILIILIRMILRNARLPIAVGVIVVAVVSSMIVLGTRTPRAGEPVVVSGVSQWGALARATLGDRAKVVTLLTDPNADPHSHEATTADAAYVAEAAIVIENGAGYDTWLSQLVDVRTTRPRVIDVANLVHVAAGMNPHLFYDVSAARRFVEALVGVAKGIGVTSTSSSTVLAALRGLEAQIHAIRTTCAGVRVAATEDVTGYLLAALGLRVVTPESLRLAVGNGVDPSVSDLATALNQLRLHPAFLVDNVQTATPLTNEMVAVARANRVPVVKVTETMTGTNYVTWISRTISEMRTDLVTEGCA